MYGVTEFCNVKPISDDADAVTECDDGKLALTVLFQGVQACASLKPPLILISPVPAAATRRAFLSFSILQHNYNDGSTVYVLSNV